MQGIILTHGNIALTNNDIYLHGNSKKKIIGSGMKPYNDTIRRMTSQVNNPSTGIAGLGSQTDVLSRSAFKPLGTSVIFGGSVSSQLGKLNFNIDKKNRNVRLRL
jgi:hypothetical protein